MPVSVDPCFPCRVPVTVLRRGAGGVDAYGNPTSSWSRETVLVFGVQVGGADEATATHPESARFDMKIYAPVDVGIGDRDRIEYVGRTYEVDGQPGDWQMNPWWSPGLVECRCNLVEG